MKALTHLVSVGLLGVAFGSAPAMAVPINVLGFEYGSSPVQITAPTSPAGGIGTFNAGAFKVNINNSAQNTVAWCADIFERISLPSGQLNYSVGSLDSTIATRLGQFATQRSLNSMSFSPEKSAAFQMVIWEILYDIPNFDLGTGSPTGFQVGAGTNNDARSQADTWLSQLNGYLPNGANHYAIDLYVNVGNPGKQDLIVFRKVPEPGSFAILLVGVGLAGVLGSRRKRA